MSMTIHVYYVLPLLLDPSKALQHPCCWEPTKLVITMVQGIRLSFLGAAMIVDSWAATSISKVYHTMVQEMS